MDLHFVAEIHGFFIENLRNSQLLRAIPASNPRISSHNLNGPDLFRGSLNISRWTDTILNTSDHPKTGVLPRVVHRPG